MPVPTLIRLRNFEKTMGNQWPPKTFSMRSLTDPVQGIDDANRTQLGNALHRPPLPPPHDVHYMAVTNLYYVEAPESANLLRQQLARMAVVFFFNSDRSNRSNPMFVGQHDAPPGLEEEERCLYLRQHNGIISPAIFESIISFFSNCLERNIVLLIDDAISHIYDKQSAFFNIEIISLPRNRLSYLHSMDAEGSLKVDTLDITIIRNVSGIFYRNQLSGDIRLA